MWYWLRSMLFYLVFFVAAAIWVWPLLLVALLSRKGGLLMMRAWCVFMIWVCRMICGIRYRLRGREHLQTCPAIIFSKHQSAWETLFLPGYLPYTCIVAKKSLFFIPFFGWGMYFSKHIPIDRGSTLQALKKVIAHGKDRLARGFSILLFPEGTRVPVGKMGKFHKSGGMLAKSTGYPIIPVAHNAGHCWQKNSLVKKPGLVDVVIGPPIETKGKSVNAINEAVFAWMSEAQKDLKN